MRTLIATAFLAAGLPAQWSAPPVNPVTQTVQYVGQRLPQLGGNNPGAQQLEAYCAPPDARQSTSTFGVALGGAIYWQSACGHPAGGYYPVGTALACFAIGEYVDGKVQSMPWAAPTFRELFLEPSALILVVPTHRYVYNSIDAWVVQLPVPNDLSLAGTQWGTQAFRADPNSGMLYLSDMIAVEVLP
jgi:hypothetical protein